MHDGEEGAAPVAHAARHLRPPRSRALRWLLIAALVPVAIVALITVAWAIDTSTQGGKVVRNVELAGRPIGGEPEEDLPQVVDDIAAEARTRTVRIVTPDATYETTAEAIGLTVDRRSTVAAAAHVGRDGALPTRPFRWLASFVSPRESAVHYEASEATVREHVIELQGDARTAPVEPSIAAAPDGIAVVPGEPGRGLDAHAIARQLPTVATSEANGSVVVAAEPGRIDPEHTDDDAAALASLAEQMTRDALRVEAGPASAEIPPEVLRTWVRARVGDDGLELLLDDATVERDLRRLVTGFDDPPVNARFDVQGGVPVVIAGEQGTVCCAPGSAGRVLAAMGTAERVATLDTVVADPEVTSDALQALGISTEIGQPGAFGPTTMHACCENRVQNIHRIADAVRGVVIMPGDTFSVNGHVGQRTREKGYLPAGAIVNGLLDEQVGGGVSQFATTLFNAALYAGLEFDEYQSHSLYISRYPRGHEATMSWEHPDLQIVNSTPHAVLVWPTYTETSITVHLYSQPYYQEVTLGEPTSSRSGRCTRWTTPRRRVTPEGEVLNDSVFAVYRPGEGVSC